MAEAQSDDHFVRRRGRRPWPRGDLPRTLVCRSMGQGARGFGMLARSACSIPHGLTELTSPTSDLSDVPSVRVLCEVRCYVVAFRVQKIGKLAGTLSLSCHVAWLASMKRQTAASLTISWFHNDGTHRHVCSIGKVKLSSSADRNEKR